MDWWAELDWSNRPDEMGELVVVDGVPGMPFRPKRITPGWDELCQTWPRWSKHPVLLQPLSIGADSTLVLRYAAIAWETTPAPDDVILRWAGQICASVHALYELVPKAVHWLFSRPFFVIDAGGSVRVGFDPPEGSSRDVDLGDVVHGLLNDLAPDVANQHLARRLRAKHEHLIQYCFDFNWREAPRNGLAKAAWERLDEGLGLLLLDKHAAALTCLEDANFILSTELTRWGVNECRAALEMPPLEMASPQKKAIVLRPERAAPMRTWADAEATIARMEAERDFKGALQLYDAIARTASGLVLARRARCHLELHETGYAIDYAQRSLALEPTRSEGHVALIRAWLEHREPAKAMVVADAYVKLATHDAMAHYLRGKALLALARLEDARDAFDLAIAFKPTMLEALLLRSETHRNLVKLGRAVGSQRVALVLPAHLEHVREVLASGRSKNIIEALSAPSLADDGDAQLMLARFLGFADRLDDAIAIYDRWMDSPHRITALIGKAGALLDQGRIESALALFDIAVAEQPTNLDACEGRARTLDTLGRTSEAAAEFRRFISLGAQRAEIRVRAAQLWLDAH